MKLTDGTGGELRSGETHHYALTLDAGWYLELVAEQDGIDLEARFVDPDGQTLLVVDTPNGRHGPEAVVALSRSAGEHRLELRAQGEPGRWGRYRLEILALRMASARDRRRATAETGFAEGENQRRRGDRDSLDRAIAHYEGALPSFLSLDEDHRAGVTLLRLGNVYRLRNRYDEALASYRRAIPFFERVGDLRQQAASVNNIGLIHRQLGQPAAKPSFELALEILRRVGDRVGEATALNNLGLVAAGAGRPFEALEHYHAALDLWRQEEILRQQAVTLSNIGEIYTSIHEIDRARDFLHQAREIQQGIGDRRGQAITLNNLALTAERADLPDEAASLYQKALELFGVVGDAVGEARTLDNLGRLHQLRGKPQEAEPAHRRALEIAQRNNDRHGEARALSNLGWLVAESDPQKALELQRKADELFSRLDAQRGRTRALHGAATALLRLGRLEEAQVEIERALAQVEDLQARMSSRALRRSFFATQRDLYAFAHDLAIERHRSDPTGGHRRRAFDIGQRARARGFLEALDDLGLRRDIAPTLLAEEQLLKSRINEAQRQQMVAISNKATTTELAPLARRLRELLSDLDRLQTRIRIQVAEESRWSGPLSQEEIQQLIDPGTLLLHYELGPERSFLWVLSRTAVELFELPSGPEIEGLARRFHHALGARERRLGQHPLRRMSWELGRMLLGPLGPRLEQQRLVIVGEGALHLVPFAALRLEPLGSPLIDRHEVVFVPSASALSALRAPRSDPTFRGELAVVADPVFTATDPRWVGRVGGEDQPSIPADTEPETLGLGEGLQRLAASGNEARAILEFFPPDRRLALIGLAADREAILGGALDGFRILHFATHGLLNPEHPELSGLMLSMVGDSGRPRDGFLDQHEILDLSLDAELVVLSACRTALGREIPGEGIAGLPRAFLYAGARGVVVSLWAVDDAATAELMTRFYRHHIELGDSPAASLRAAQRSLASETRWRAPVFWAGFVLQGDWR